MKRRIPTVIDDSEKFKLIDVVQGATEAGYVVEGVIAKRGMERRDIHGDVDVDLLNQDDEVVATLGSPRRRGRSLVASATGCNSNLEKTPYGKLAVTLVERTSNRAIRVSYKPSLQQQIGASTFMTKRGQGIEPDDIPEAEQLELLDLVWNAPESDIWTIGMIFQFERDGCPRSWALSPARPAVSRPPGPVCASWAKSRSVFPARATNGEQRARFVRVGHQLRAPNTPHSAGRENTL